MRSRITLAVGALGVALALPAGASAAGSVSGGPVKVTGGYSVFLHAQDGRPDTVMISIDRGTTANGQSDIITVTRGVNVKVGRGSASIKGSLGRRGSVDLRLRGARVSRGKLRPGCVGTPSTTYVGRLEGKLRLRLPSGRSVTIRSLPGTSSLGGDVTCKPTKAPGTGGGDGSGDRGGEPRLMLSMRDAGTMVTFTATNGTLMLMRMSDPANERGATVAAMSMVRASGSNLLTVSGGGASAGVKSAGAFTGNGVFSAKMVAESTTTGPLSGSLRVKPQGGPVISIAGDDALLLDADKG